MKKTKILIISLVIVALSGMLMGNACEKLEEASEALCGPCPDPSEGGASIVGDARVDGFFRAVANLNASMGSIDVGFKANLGELAAVYDIDISGMSSSEIAAAIKTEITTDISANLEGNVSYKYTPPKCTANASLAIEAQASCEVEAGCTADCDPGSVELKCEGSCSGGCTGGCDGKMECNLELSAEGKCEGSCSGSCEVKAPSFACSGTCSGTCTVEAGVHCSGTCSGNCTGTCDGSTADGVTCNGVCEGECDASCSMNGSVQCEGDCNGSCEYDPGTAQCEGSCKGECTATVTAEADCSGEIKCEGSCTGSCSGGCEGNIEPPSCAVDCNASADCQASASAEASASIECTPPSLDLDYTFKAGVDAKAKAEFFARFEKVRSGFSGVINGFAKLKLLVEGDGTIEPPAIALQASLQGIGQAIIDGDINIDVPPFRIGCVAGAVSTAVSDLKSVVTTGTGMITAQIDLVSAIGLDL